MADQYIHVVVLNSLGSQAKINPQLPIRKLWPRFKPVQLNHLNYSPSPILRQKKKSRMKLEPLKNKSELGNIKTSLDEKS